MTCNENKISLHEFLYSFVIFNGIICILYILNKLQICRNKQNEIHILFKQIVVVSNLIVKCGS